MPKFPIGTVLKFERAGRFTYAQVVFNTPTLAWLFNITGAISAPATSDAVERLVLDPSTPRRLAMVAANSSTGQTGLLHDSVTG